MYLKYFQPLSVGSAPQSSLTKFQVEEGPEGAVSEYLHFIQGAKITYPREV